MKRAYREWRAEIARQGLVIVEIIESGHKKVRVAAPDGRTALIVISRSPSDVHAIHQIKAQLKRFARPAPAAKAERMLAAGKTRNVSAPP